MREIVNGESMLRVETPKFTVVSPQIYYDYWWHQDRIVRFDGRCINCGRRCYSTDDGDGDPRGILGDNAGCNLDASDFDMIGPEIVACFDCQNNGEEKYHNLIRLAKRKWKEKFPSPITFSVGK